MTKAIQDEHHKIAVTVNSPRDFKILSNQLKRVSRDSYQFTIEDYVKADINHTNDEIGFQFDGVLEYTATVIVTIERDTKSIVRVTEHFAVDDVHARSRQYASYTSMSTEFAKIARDHYYDNNLSHQLVVNVEDVG